MRHTTLYRYRRPVRFGEHRLMFRPRDSHDMRLVETWLGVEPKPAVRWQHDVFGNSIALLSFEAESDRLRLESGFVVEHYGLEEPECPIEPFAQHLPFSYAAEEIPDLGRTIERHYPDSKRRLDAWAKAFLPASGTGETWPLLIAMTAAIKERFAYVERDEEGIQTPVRTLEQGQGTCRDFALLMMEAVRSLGLAARFVTGYLYDPGIEHGEGVRGSGHTHAWVQIYLPGAGWVEFDPTNGIVGGNNLLRVAVARDPSQAIPIRGSYYGAAEDFLDLTVEVTVSGERDVPVNSDRGLV